MPLFDIEIFKSLNGRSNRDQFSNTHHIAVDAAIDSESLDTVARAIITREQAIHTSNVHFLRARVTQRAENRYNKPDNAFVNVESEELGLRTPIGGLGEADTAPLELAVLVKRDTTNGRSGRLYYRGVLGENEVETTSNSQFAIVQDSGLSTPRADIAAAIAGLDAPLPEGAIFVMPNKVDTFTEQFAQTGRAVKSHKLGGLVVLKTARSRKSVDQDVIEATQRLVNRNTRAMEKIGGNAPLRLLSGSSLTAAMPLILEIVAAFKGLTAIQRAQVRLPGVLKALPAFEAALGVL